jgi:type IV pilus assembly protein PilC
MTNYQFRLRDLTGDIRSGTLEAESVEAATAKLREPGVQILEVEEAVAEGGLFPRRVSKQELIYLTSQLAIMVDTGITLSAALGGILQQEENPTLKKILADLKNSVENGDDFSTALARYPRLFDKTFISLVKASEATGMLGTMLERIAVYLRKELETRGKVRAAMAYPAVMMFVATNVTIFLLTYILPKFTPLFKSRGTKLPGVTLALMNTSSNMMTYWYIWLGLAVGLVGGFVYGKRTPRGRQMLDYVKINMPIMGPMFRKVTISRSIRTLGTMLAAGVAMIEAIRLAGEVCGNVHYEKLWNTVADEVTGGCRICEVLQRSTLFPRVLIQMIACGEETAKLDMILERVSGYYDQEVDTAVKAATSMIEPIMISVMGVVVGTIGMALLLPIFSLSKQP